MLPVDYAKLIDLTYQLALGRKPEAEALTVRVHALKHGARFEHMFVDIATSDEAKAFAASEKMFPDMSDGEFLMSVGRLVYGRGLTPGEIVIWQRFINEYSPHRMTFMQSMIGEFVRKRTQSAAVTHDADACWIMGTKRTLSKSDWGRRKQALVRDGLKLKVEKPGEGCMLESLPFEHAGAFKVSMIASLYKGGKFIRKFLDNITSQSIFNMSELIIVDADSPEREWETIEEYQKIFPNIVYKRFNYRIGIYEAWNVGVELARGTYLTNTNLDDLRRRDSIELQAAMLDANAGVDVVYQDFYYSFDGDLSFDDVAAYGFKSDLPIVSPNNLLMFNSPHNAPMWRKSLHKEVGFFDARYKSAGDWDFWIRCLAAGKTFRKINSPHVVYFQNPEGLSTRADTRGVQEGQDVLTRHGDDLVPRTLLLSKRGFYARLGVDVDDSEEARERSYFDVAQEELRRLGAGRRTGAVSGAASTDGQMFAAATS